MKDGSTKKKLSMSVENKGIDFKIQFLIYSTEEADDTNSTHIPNHLYIKYMQTKGAILDFYNFIEKINKKLEDEELICWRLL